MVEVVEEEVKEEEEAGRKEDVIARLHLCSDTPMDFVFGTKRIGSEFAGGGRCGRTEEDGLGGEFVGDVEDTEDFLDLEVEFWSAGS